MWQFVSNAFTFILIYLLTTLIAKFIRFFNPNPKMLYIKSQGIYNFLVFPNNIFSRNRDSKKKKKDRHLMLSELIFCILNQVILVGAIVLQFLPSMPCDTIEVTFGWRHRGLDFIVNTYNQKIPLCLILVLMCAEALFLFITPLFRSFCDKEMRKKLGVGAIIGIIAICLLCFVLLLYFIYLMF